MKVFAVTVLLLCLTVTRGVEMQCFACSLAAADADQCSIGECGPSITQCFTREYTENEEKILVKGCAIPEMVKNAAEKGDVLCEGSLCNSGSILSYSLATLFTMLLLH